MANRTNEVEFQASVDLDESDLNRIKELKGIQYKFFVAQKALSAEMPPGPLFIKFIEYNWRQIDLEKIWPPEGTAEINDKWPNVDQENRRTRIDSGWLIDHHEHEIQFHFFDLPFELWSPGSEGKETNTAVPAAAGFVLNILPFKPTSKGLTELKDYLVLTNV